MEPHDGVRTKVILALTVPVGILAVTLALFRPLPHSAAPEPPAADANPLAAPAHALRPAAAPAAIPSPRLRAARASDVAASKPLAQEPVSTTNKLARLTQIRESFRALAAGDPAGALRAAKRITDETERETALFTLVTEWTQGEINSPGERASAIAAYGLEAGLGLELAKFPDLAVLWANELTDGAGRTAVLQQAAVALLDSDPAGAFALSEHLPPEQRRGFFDGLFAGWAEKDTATAVDWANQFSAPAEREAALRAIRSVAPVGIGAAIGVQQGYPVINQLLPGTPAALSGQVHPGDRILALAQGDNAFVDARNLPLQDVVQMIRGAPGTVLQLQVLSADAPPESPPRTISILRDQIKFKR